MGPARHEFIAFVFLLTLGCVFRGISLNLQTRDVIDLIQSLNTTYSSSGGFKYILGSNNYSKALFLTDGQRHLAVSDAVTIQAQNLLGKKEITFLATLKQEIGDSGSILSFSSDLIRFLEIESSGRRNEIRFHYTHDQDIQVETFPYRLGDNLWHKLAVTLSGTHLRLFVDCKEIYQRVIQTLDTEYTAGKLSLFVGQRNGQHGLFRGGLQDVKIVTESHGYLLQCPNQNTACPTCAQYQALEKQVENMYRNFENLQTKLLQAEEKISQLEQCSCHKCFDNGTMRKEGEMWRPNICTICTCKNGSVECHRRNCSKPDCRNPEYRKCCSPESHNCCHLSTSEYYNNGEEVNRKNCIKCTCKNGSMICEKQNMDEICPPLNCSSSERVFVDGQCCPVCKGTNFCARGNDCHSNATCLNMETKYICHCKLGFRGNGSHCEDIDECISHGGKNGHHCNGNTMCVNTVGSYRCQCSAHEGDEDVDTCEGATVECSPAGNTCHTHASCTNIDAMYRCHCSHGYHGNGRYCKPVCEGGCQNGGSCLDPNVCECRNGYMGAHCELDIDECALEIDACVGHSVCVNIPGWYHCLCVEGFQSVWNDSQSGALCVDINECVGEGEGHTCHPSADCYNLEGSYRCQCPHGDRVCSHSCIYESKYYGNNTRWMSEVEPCQECSCQAGVTECHALKCDCTVDNVNHMCCPHCDQSQRCQHQEGTLMHNNGERWIFQCQTCECLMGEIDCWPLECPELKCDNTVKWPGNCCPNCVNSNPCLEPALLPSVNGDRHHDNQCTFKGHRFNNGEVWKLNDDQCTTCECKSGHICCAFKQTCSIISGSP